jgi:hypothetical protein
LGAAGTFFEAQRIHRYWKNVKNIKVFKGHAVTTELLKEICLLSNVLQSLCTTMLKEETIIRDKGSRKRK